MSKTVIGFINVEIQLKTKAVAELKSSIKANRDQIDAWQRELDTCNKDIDELKAAKAKIENA